MSRLILTMGYASTKRDHLYDIWDGDILYKNVSFRLKVKRTL